MAYGRTNTERGTWYQEQKSLINSASETERASLSDNFGKRFEAAATAISDSYNGLNVMRDAKRMMENPQIMLEYKTEFLQPILDELTSFECEPADRVHLESVANELSAAWDENVKTFVMESYNTQNYLPLSTLDFPALIKQYIRFLGKEIMPVQTASSTNIEQRIFTKYLVNNQTGEEFETPAIYFKKEADGTPTLKKLYNAGRGYRINPAVITLASIASATNKKYNVYAHLLDDAGAPYTLTPTVRTRLSWDLTIKYVQVTLPNKVEGQPAVVSKVRLPGAGIQIDIQTGGLFINGAIVDTMKLPIVDSKNVPTGEYVQFSDRLSGAVDFIKGTITASSCGVITGIFCDGHVSNETNTRTIGFREYPEIRKFLISDECRFLLPFTVEDFAEANASLNFNLYNRLVQELVTNQEMFEDSSILEYLDNDFKEHDEPLAFVDGISDDIVNLESYTHTEYVDLKPPTTTTTTIFEYRTQAIQNAIASTIYELTDRGKLDNLGFVVYGNPKAIRLIQEYVTWTVQKSTEIGGVQMNHAFGVMTDTDVPIRVVASNRISAYTTIPAYQTGSTEGDLSREYFFKIVAYPMDKNHISYKHLRFARHLTNSPENAAYADAQNPGGAAVVVMATSQYKTISIQGIQGMVICHNTKDIVPDIKAGLITTTIGG